MGRAQFSDIVNLSQPAMVQLLVGLATQVAAVGKAQDGAGGGKFTGELKGGPLDDFYKGVTGVCGEPDADIEKGESSKCPNPLFSPPPFAKTLNPEPKTLNQGCARSTPCSPTRTTSFPPPTMG